jgi:hypothetical protein
MNASINEIPKLKEHMDNTRIKLLKLMKTYYTLILSTVGFIYKILTNLQSDHRDLLFNFSSFERMAMMEDERYVLGR